MCYEYLPNTPPQTIKTSFKSPLLQLQIDMPPCHTLQATLADFCFLYNYSNPHTEQRVSLRDIALTYENQNHSESMHNIWSNKGTNNEPTLEYRFKADPKEEQQSLVVSNATFTVNTHLILAVYEMVNSFSPIAAIPKAYTEPMSRSLVPKPHTKTEVKVSRVFVALQASESDLIVVSLPNSAFHISN
jgi:hypothetical protein